MTRIKRIAAWAAAIVLTLTMAFVGITPASAFSASNAEAVVASAATNENAFDATSVNDDLKGMNLDELLPDSITEPSAVKFVEYCFGDAAIKCGNYALYLYVYNPTNKKITPFEAVNKIEIATEYNEKGDPSKYDKLSLRLCGISTGNIEGLVYKYRVLDENSKVLNNALAQDEKSGERRYDVSGFELWEIGTDGAAEYKVAKIYRYTGYAEGYGAAGEESTLTCTSQNTKTISLEPSFTNYRMSSAYKTEWVSMRRTYMEVNTAYFSIEDTYIKDYGKLQKVHAEWYEYKTSPIFVTDDTYAIDNLKNYIGVYADQKGLVDGCDYAVRCGSDQDTTSYIAYNKKLNSSYAEGDVVKEIIPVMAWLFGTDGESYKNAKITREQVKDWASNYCLLYGKTADILGKYSSDLFAESIDADRVEKLQNPADKRGYMNLTLDADKDRNLLLSYDDTHSGWDKFFDYFGRWWENSSVNSEYDYSPIYEVTAADLTLSETDFCNKLLVNSFDYKSVYDWAEKSIKAGEHPHLFRYAKTDFTQTAMRFDSISNIFNSPEDGYIAEETVFLNFDVIDLTFRSEEGVDTVIPVVMDPVDVFNGLDPAIVYGPDWDELLKLILSVIGVIILILIVVMFWGPVKAVLGLVWDIISAPFKWLWNIFKGGGKK